MSSFDCITVGNAIIDSFLTIHDTHARLDETTGELCFKHGQKIHVESAEFLLGGNACNVSVGLARIGLRTALIAELGDDEFSLKITNGLAKELVSEELLIKTKGAQSSFAIGINFKGERTLFVEHVKRAHNFHFEGVTSAWMYLTSLGQEWEAPYEKALAYKKSQNIKLAFNPGTYQLQMMGEMVSKVIEQTDILFVNKEEAMIISNFQFPIPKEQGESEDIKQLLQKLHEMGAKIVVVTDGLKGSYVYDGQQSFHVGLFPDTCIERTGAGDAYASGFLGSVIRGNSFEVSGQWGAVNAASVVEHIGAQKGLLSDEEIEKKLKSHPQFQAESF